MNFRPVTDGAGNEILAQLNVTVDVLNGEEVSTVRSSDYTSKSWLTEDTGRNISTILATINSLASGLVTKLNNIDASANNYTLPTATSNVLGGVMLGSDTIQSISANSVSSTNSRTYAVQVNSSGQLVVNVPWTNTNTNYYPTTWSWTNGTSNGPTATLSGSGMSSVVVAAIPKASSSQSGIVTTAAQTFAGDKSFSGSILPSSSGGTNTIGSSTYIWSNVYATTFTGALSGNASTATALATARTIRTNLASTSTASFDGSANITPGVTGTLPVGNGGTGNTTGTATYATTAASTTSTIYPVGVTSSATTTLVRDTSITMTGGVITATTFSGNATSASKVENALTATINGTAYSFDGSAAKSFSFYAPTSAGTADYVLKSNGSGAAPTWVQLGTLTTDYELPTATTSVLGGVMLGSDSVQTATSATIGSTAGRTYLVQVNSSGQLVVNVPWSDTNTHYTSYLYIGASGSASNAATSNGSTYLKLYENGTSRSSFKITGSGATTVASDSSGNITISSTNTTYSAATTSSNGLMSASDKAKLDGIDESANNYSLPTATSSVLGGVMLGSNTVQSIAANNVSATSSRTYAVQVNSSGQLVVNVPWTTDVTQTLSNADNEYPLLARYVTSTTTLDTSTRFAAGVTLNPSTGTISATTFNGALSGNASTATKVQNSIILGNVDRGGVEFDGSESQEIVTFVYTILFHAYNCSITIFTHQLLRNSTSVLSNSLYNISTVLTAIATQFEGEIFATTMYDKDDTGDIYTGLATNGTALYFYKSNSASNGTTMETVSSPTGSAYVYRYDF